MVESNYDFIYLFDGSDTQIGKYTGSSLAGKTITIPGETFKIKLTSDGSVSKYGYSFSLITAQISGSTVSDDIRKEFDGITAQVEELKKNTDAAQADVKETLAELSEKLDEILMKIESCASGRHQFVNHTTVKAGFFRKLISFFKNLFGSNRTVIQAFRSVY